MKININEFCKTIAIIAVAIITIIYLLTTNLKT